MFISGDGDPRFGDFQQLAEPPATGLDTRGYGRIRRLPVRLEVGDEVGGVDQPAVLLVAERGFQLALELGALLVVQVGAVNFLDVRIEGITEMSFVSFGRRML